MATGMPSSPAFSNTASSPGSSTASSLPPALGAESEDLGDLQAASPQSPGPLKVGGHALAVAGRLAQRPVEVSKRRGCDRRRSRCRPKVIEPTAAGGPERLIAWTMPWRSNRRAARLAAPRRTWVWTSMRGMSLRTNGARTAGAVGAGDGPLGGGPTRWLGADERQAGSRKKAAQSSVLGPRHETERQGSLRTAAQSVAAWAPLANPPGVSQPVARARVPKSRRRPRKRGSEVIRSGRGGLSSLLGRRGPGLAPQRALAGAAGSLTSWGLGRGEPPRAEPSSRAAS